MRAKGKDRVKQWKEGINSFQKKLNVHSTDHCDLVEDVRDLEKRIQDDPGSERIIIVDLGQSSDGVQFVYFQAQGYIDGVVGEVA